MIQEIELKFDCELKELSRKIQRLTEWLKRPKRWPRTRKVITIPFFSLWLRHSSWQKWWPSYRWVGSQRHILELSCWGVVALVSCREGPIRIKPLTPAFVTSIMIETINTAEEACKVAEDK